MLNAVNIEYGRQGFLVVATDRSLKFCQQKLNFVSSSIENAVLRVKGDDSKEISCLESETRTPRT